MISRASADRLMNEQRHPVQPLITDALGRQRFKANPIVRYLLDNGGIDMNEIATLPFDDDDRQHFAQLIGYSICGFSELSYVSDDALDRVELAHGALGR